jgi:vacuolar protein sorting-associated protein 13A/C
MQIDNQLPLTSMPVLLAPECKEKEESVLEIVLQMKSDSSEVKEVYPCIVLKTTESAWRLNIHEEMIWVAVEMYSYLRLDRLSSDSDVVQVDPEIQVELLHMSEVRFKLTIETCPEQRPPGKLGIWGPIVSTVGNISKMPVCVVQYIIVLSISIFSHSLHTFSQPFFIFYMMCKEQPPERFV